MSVNLNCSASKQPLDAIVELNYEASSDEEEKAAAALETIE